MDPPNANRYLAAQYEGAMRLNAPENDLYTVRPAPGEEVPRVKRWLLTYRGPTLVKRADGTIGRQMETVVQIELGDAPEEPMRATVVAGRTPFHPNWAPEGAMHNGPLWLPSVTLADYIAFVCETLQFQPHLIDPGTAVNEEAWGYCQAHRRDEPPLFPLDARPAQGPNANL